MCGKVIRTTTDDIYDNGGEYGKRELVLNMYKNGMSADAIAKMVQISLETITQWISGTAKPARQPILITNRRCLGHSRVTKKQHNISFTTSPDISGRPFLLKDVIRSVGERRCVRPGGVKAAGRIRKEQAGSHRGVQ